MASIFTYEPNPTRVSSPWSTPGRATPVSECEESNLGQRLPNASSSPLYLSETGISRLEAEPQDGPTEYKLHLLLRPRRTFLSTSTSHHTNVHQQPYGSLPKAGLQGTALTPAHALQQPSTQSRQTRLQQLTTQLLWRLQQSSPFHSCSTASLVLPTLPEATPKLGIPRKPATLLPGLEESQGALYEIGVSDDGTFVGLTADELDESLTNLRAMAASLGCVVDLLRKVIVGHCEWTDSEESVNNSPAKVQADDLWVAEALVRPEMERPTEPPCTPSSSDPDPKTVNGLQVPHPELSHSDVVQLRVSLAGATTSGKSSLVGTLTTSRLDNGRGKSRLNLLKHRHEVVSGVTSSVAQQLIGYRKQHQRQGPDQADSMPEVINYASENVSSWNDIHAFAARLVLLSDSPGLPRYSKSSIRTLVSWNPHWTIVCISADCGDRHMSAKSRPATLSSETDLMSDLGSRITHLELCLKLNLPIIVAVTKMDIATKFNLRQTMSKLLSALKAAGKKPILMSTSHRQGLSINDQAFDLQHISQADEAEVGRVMRMVDEMGIAVVPIVLTSAMSGQGVGKLHGLLRSIPILKSTAKSPAEGPSSIHPQAKNRTPSTIFQVDEVFSMPPSNVYTASRNVGESNQGTVLCGYVSTNSISIGDHLTLGPFLVESNSPRMPRSRSLHRSMSFPSSGIHKPPTHVYSKSIPAPGAPTLSKPRVSTNAAVWQPVRVVSLRNLRLPTRSLLAGQVGTVGIEPIPNVGSSCCDIRFARKGMLLTSLEDGVPIAYRSFTASFPASDFRASGSPPLILGGHATVYVNSIRSAVKVISVALAEHDSDTELSGRDDSSDFAVDGDDQGAKEGQNIRIRFKFLSSVEWMRLDDTVLVVPNAVAVGPITGGSVAAASGLDGFVGRICDLHV